MGSTYLPFLARFANHRPLLAPLTKAPTHALEDLYMQVGVGWFKGNLIHILEPAIIDDLKNALQPIQRLQNKIPFAITALGDLILLETATPQVLVFDFSNNTLTKVSGSLEDFLNTKLFDEDYNPKLNVVLVNQLSNKFGPLTTLEVYKPNLPIILGGEKKLESYQKSSFFAFINEMVPIINQWEALKNDK